MYHKYEPMIDIKKIQFKALFVLVSRISLLCVTLLYVAGCNKNNVEYKLINNSGLFCKIEGAKASKLDYENGVMTPMDGVFDLFSCLIYESVEKSRLMVISMKSKEMTNGVLRSEQFGDFKIKYYRTRSEEHTSELQSH